MFDVADSLKPALREAQRRLEDAAAATASAGAHGDSSTDRVMAQAAQAALFENALLSATHARIAEVKAVTKQ